MPRTAPTRAAKKPPAAATAAPQARRPAASSDVPTTETPVQAAPAATAEIVAEITPEIARPPAPTPAPPTPDRAAVDPSPAPPAPATSPAEKEVTSSAVVPNAVSTQAAEAADAPPASANEGPAQAKSTTADEMSDEISREIAQAALVVSASPGQDSPASAAPIEDRELPDLEVDLDDPTALLITPTVLSVPNKILARFERARPHAASHTALVLDALRAHAAQLPDLVAALRPGPRPGDLFPYRATPGAPSGDRPGPLRIRPTAGELAIMDGLTTWVNNQIRRGRAGVRKVSRSEVVSVALDAYLPQAKGGTRR